MDTACRQEIVELHQFFQDWFSGQGASGSQDFERLAGVLAEGFELIGPDGERAVRDELLQRLSAAHGSQRSKLRIWIDDYRGRSLAEDLQVVTYREWQDVEGEVRGRLSTALFRRRDGAPCGVEWLHVHEVWLPSGTRPA